MRYTYLRLAYLLTYYCRPVSYCVSRNNED